MPILIIYACIYVADGFAWLEARDSMKHWGWQWTVAQLSRMHRSQKYELGTFLMLLCQAWVVKVKLNLCFIIVKLPL